MFLLWASVPFNTLDTFSVSFIGDPVLLLMDDREHPLLYFPGTGKASQKTAISNSCQQALVGIHNSVWVWLLFMGWISRWGSLWMVLLSVSVRNFVSVTPSMGILFLILRRNIVLTLWSSFLNFTWFANCFLGIPNFWANIHISVSTYCVSSFVIGLPHSV